MRTELLKKIEWAIAILLSVTVLFFLVVRATHAGGLWRDECGTMQLAGMFENVPLAVVEGWEESTTE
jgi:hypothetical protein